MAASEKSANFKVACYLSIVCPLTLSVLGWPCAPTFQERLYRGALVWNTLLCFTVLKSPSSNVQTFCVHLKTICTYPGLFIAARWWCGQPALLWVASCAVALIFQINLRIWINSQWWWVHLTMHLAIPFIVQHHYHDAASAYGIGRHLSDKLGPGAADKFSDWIVPIIVTLASTAAGLVVLYAKPRCTIFRRKTETPAQPVVFDSFDVVVPVPLEHVELAAAEEEQREDDRKPRIRAFTVDRFCVPGAVGDGSQDTATISTSCDASGSMGSISEFVRDDDIALELAPIRSERSITSAITLSTTNSAPQIFSSSSTPVAQTLAS